MFKSFPEPEMPDPYELARARGPMIPMVNVIVLDVGTFKITDRLATIYQAAKIRGDGQPDMRTKYGKMWRKEFEAYRAEKTREFLA